MTSSSTYSNNNKFSFSFIIKRLKDREITRPRYSNRKKLKAKFLKTNNYSNPPFESAFWSFLLKIPRESFNGQKSFAHSPKLFSCKLNKIISRNISLPKAENIYYNIWYYKQMPLIKSSYFHEWAHSPNKNIKMYVRDIIKMNFIITQCFQFIQFPMNINSAHLKILLKLHAHLLYANQQ